MEIAIAYRSNDVFDHFVPRIQKILESLSHEVTVKVLPRGCDPDDHREEICILADEVEAAGGVFLADNTIGAGETKPLDDVVGEFFTDGLSHGEDEAKALFQTVLRIRVEKLGAPEQIVIDPKHITDHWPNNLSKDVAISDVQNILEGWIREVLPDCKISKSSSFKACPWQVPEGTWVVGDRHEWTYASDTVMRLPAYNLMHDCASQGFSVREVTDERILEGVRAWDTKFGAG